MQPRIDYHKAPPGAAKVMLELQHCVDKCGLEPALLALVKLRASQINGCAFCIDMQTKDARAMGETEQRLYALNAWHEAPFYTDREWAALARTEAVTLVTDGHVSDEIYAHGRQHISEQEVVNLTMAVVAINGWNRLAISFRWLAGDYQPKRSSLT
jgi:AhpD family alkylhydroperoxidase